MALSYRKRGEVWHCRGTVRVGREVIAVREFSTGCRARADAEAAGAAEEARIRAEFLDGPAGRAKRLAIAEALAAYLRRVGGVKPYDVDRVAAINEAIGHRPIAEAAAAWREFIAAKGWAPGTVARWRNVLSAALNEGCAALAVPDPPKLPKVKASQGDGERLVYLTAEERRRLLAAYNPHAAQPALLLAYQGLRTQEALQLDWRRVDFTRRTLHIPAERTKSGKGRTVPMHPRVDALLFGIWHARGKPAAGPVFHSSKPGPDGRPRAYADTRGQGGNPLDTAHRHACQIAGVAGFRMHDWRHDWAARMVMGGADLYTLMRLGGWSSLRMVERYAAVTGEHMAEALRRIA